MDDNQFPVSLPLFSAPMPLQGKRRAPFQPLQDFKFRLLAWPERVPGSDQDQEEIVLPFFHQPSKSGQVTSSASRAFELQQMPSTISSIACHSQILELADTDFEFLWYTCTLLEVSEHPLEQDKLLVHGLT
ncbi:hypothetical protein M405DRAFT_878491 [Rhizopogon salebrosus TDB-379]|nr:hypothetical protein M405DRAFT_878491 [Rhizopogon salebrosus TDB-379]